MNREIIIRYDLTKNIEKDIPEQTKKADEAYEKLISGGFQMTGWLDHPHKISEDMFCQIWDIADRIRNKYTALVIVGIGGSYLGTCAALNFISDKLDEASPKIFFAGINLSTDYHEKILEEISDENVALLITSKSGETTEILALGNFFKEYVEEKYGRNDAKNRIFVVTGTNNGNLEKLAEKESYGSLPIPEDIGGRFSVLSAVGLLPMAVAGLDIRETINGAKAAVQKTNVEKAKRLAAVRNALENNGYTAELFVSFEPYFHDYIQWIKQLYGESEGKKGKGMFPIDLEYTKDLHSLGQFIQEGRQFFAETFIGIKESSADIDIKSDWGISERDISLGELNDVAKAGTIAAHRSAGIPVIQMELPGRDEYSFGQAVYFHQLSCSIRGIMMGIDPFDQPGVEKYKNEMKKNLK